MCSGLPCYSTRHGACESELGKGADLATRVLPDEIATRDRHAGCGDDGAFKNCYVLVRRKISSGGTHWEHKNDAIQLRVLQVSCALSPRQLAEVAVSVVGAIAASRELSTTENVGYQST